MTAHVYVDQTTCRSSVDSSDDIYLAIFRGNVEAPFHSSMSIIHPAAFDDFDDGESRGNDIKLAQYHANRVYVVALLERDADNDFLDNGERGLDLMRAQAHLAWTTRMGALVLAGNGAVDEDDRDSGADAVITAMQGTIGLQTTWPVGDDDPIGRARRLRIAPGQEPQLSFIGDGGSYRLRFKIKPH